MSEIEINEDDAVINDAAIVADTTIDEVIIEDAPVATPNQKKPSPYKTKRRHHGYDDYEHSLIPIKRPIIVSFKRADGSIRKETINELLLREPDAGDMELIDAEGGKSTAVLRPILARLCDVNEKIIQKLKVQDYKEVVKEFQNFTADGLEIGEIF